MIKIEGLTNNIQQVVELGNQIFPSTLSSKINLARSKETEIGAKEKIVLRLLNYIGQKNVWPLLVTGAKISEGLTLSEDRIVDDLKQLADHPQNLSLKLSGSFRFGFEKKVGSFFLSRPEQPKPPNPPAIVNFVSDKTLIERLGEKSKWQNQKYFDNRRLFDNNWQHHEQDPLWNHDLMMADTFGWFVDNLMTEENYHLFLQDISSLFKSALQIGPLVSISLEKAGKSQVETKARAREAQLLLEKLSNLLSSPPVK